MREIKFRVWNPKTKEYFLQFNGSSTTLALEYYETTPKVNFPEQFIGLKDKNDDDIYEGDIVYVGNSTGGYECEVKFMDGMFAFVTKSIYNTGQVVSGLDIRLNNWYLEVRGNVNQL